MAHLGHVVTAVSLSVSILVLLCEHCPGTMTCQSSYTHIILHMLYKTDATTGGTDDYAKGGAGVKYAFCPELRGSSFVISTTQIPLSFNEVWNGLVVMCDTIASIEGK